MSRLRIIGLAAVGLCLASCLAYGFPQPVFDLDALERASKLIVIAEVQDIQQLGDTTLAVNDAEVECAEFKARCTVLRILKGTEPDDAPVSVHFFRAKAGPFGLEQLRKGETAVLFLSTNDEGSLVFASPRRSKVPLDAYVDAADSATASLRERIARQLLHDLQMQGTEQLERSLFWAGEIGYTIPQEALATLSSDARPEVQAVALAELAGRGNREAIEQAGALILAGNLDARRAVDLAWAMERSAKKVPVATANKIAAHSSPEVSRAGIEILRAVGDESSLPVLIAGLDHENRDAQYSAVVALARITGLPAASWRDFMQDPAAEIARWKDWWQKSGRAPSQG